jgi:hypothetical protein
MVTSMKRMFSPPAMFRGDGTLLGMQAGNLQSQHTGCQSSMCAVLEIEPQQVTNGMTFVDNGAR